MSDLDDELRNAVRDVEALDGEARTQGATDPVVAETPARAAVSDAATGGKRNLGLLLGLLGVGALALSVVLGTSSDGLQFGRSVDQVLEGGGQDEGKVLTIEGRLVHGSLMKRDQPCEYRFELSSKEANRDGRLEVRYPVCIVPDNFRDVAGIDVDVTATGRMQGGVLVADNISTKCPTKYEMQQQQELGVQAPHGAPSDAAIDGLGLQPDEPKKTLGFDD